MRRRDKEVTDIKEIENNIRRISICRLGLSVNDIPYIVPMNFGYKDNCLYFHSAKVGKKLDMLNENINVCFEMDCDNELIKSEKSSKWGMKYFSIIGFGKAQIVDEFEAKKEALKIIMSHYTERTSFEYNEKAIDAVTIIKVNISKMSGKKSGY